MKKQLIFIILLNFLGLSNVGNAQAPNWLWAKSAGGNGDDQSTGVAVDANGNALVIGIFKSPTITFGSTTLTNSGTYDMYIVKYDPAGNVLWAKSAIGAHDDNPTDIAVDDFGNSYVSGHFQSPTITFGITTLTNVDINNTDIFIVKYDIAGNVVWAKSAGGPSGEEAMSIALDGMGNFYISGQFSSSINFGSNTLTCTNGDDIFIAKYDTNGNPIWARSAGGASPDFGLSIAVDVSGNSYVTGAFYSPTISFGSITLLNADNTGTSTDLFIAKYNAAGNVIWAKSAGDSASDYGIAIASDANGNCYLTGNYISSLTFGSLTFSDTSGGGNGGGNQIFIAKFDAAGNVIWAKSTTGYHGAYCEGIDLDTNGNSYIVGEFFAGGATITFGSYTLTTVDNLGGSDAFIVKYDAVGNVIWAKSAGGLGNDSGIDIAVDGIGSCYVIGNIGSDPINFDGTTVTNVDGNTEDLYVAKLNNISGITELPYGNNFTISPNPFTSQTSIIFNTEQTNSIIKVTDVLGKEIKSATFSGKQYILEKGEMNEGTYFVRIIDEKKKVTNSVIINQ